jgi:hypothetical protein
MRGGEGEVREGGGGGERREGGGGAGEGGEGEGGEGEGGEAEAGLSGKSFETRFITSSVSDVSVPFPKCTVTWFYHVITYFLYFTVWDLKCPYHSAPFLVYERVANGGGGGPWWGGGRGGGVCLCVSVRVCACLCVSVSVYACLSRFV